MPAKRYLEIQYMKNIVKIFMVLAVLLLLNPITALAEVDTVSGASEDTQPPATATPSPTPTPTPSPTPTPTATPTAEPTATPSPEPTATATPTATIVPAAQESSTSPLAAYIV